MYWVFNREMLDRALVEYEVRRQREGATEGQARDETTLIKLFLISPEAERNKLVPAKGY
jgi:hypothetical protein